MYGVMAAMFLATLTGHPLFAIGVVFIAMPSAWLFNLHCASCGWLVYREFGTASENYAKDQFLAPLHSKQLWKQPSACTNCGHPFRSVETNLKAGSNAQTH